MTLLHWLQSDKQWCKHPSSSWNPVLLDKELKHSSWTEVMEGKAIGSTHRGQESKVTTQHAESSKYTDRNSVSHYFHLARITVCHRRSVVPERRCRPVSEEKDHHVKQRDGHLGTAHHQPAVGAGDHSSVPTQTSRQGQIPKALTTHTQGATPASELSTFPSKQAVSSTWKIRKQQIEVTSRWNEAWEIWKSKKKRTYQWWLSG